MKHNHFNRWLSFALGFLLIAASALCLFACQEDITTTPPAEEKAPEEVVETPADDAVLGEGEKQFTLIVTDDKGEEKAFEIHSDADTVGKALLDLGLIEGEEGDYGLYVKKVNGITADYAVTGTYWAFYIDGEYAMTGVDQTAIENGKTYTFKAEKG